MDVESVAVTRVSASEDSLKLVELPDMIGWCKAQSRLMGAGAYY
jgi:hypothetical protein